MKCDSTNNNSPLLVPHEFSRAFRTTFDNPTMLVDKIILYASQPNYHPRLELVR